MLLVCLLPILVAGPLSLILIALGAIARTHRSTGPRAAAIIGAGITYPFLSLFTSPQQLAVWSHEFNRGISISNVLASAIVAGALYFATNSRSIVIACAIACVVRAALIVPLWLIEDGSSALNFVTWLASIIAWHAIILVEIIRWRNRQIELLPPICPSCNYNLTGIRPDRCPECGLKLNWKRRHCTECGHRLLRLCSDNCPKCGAPARVDIGKSEST